MIRPSNHVSAYRGGLPGSLIDSPSVVDPDEEQREQVRALLRRQSEEASRLAVAFGGAHGMHQTDVAALAAIAESRAPLGPATLARALRLSRPATTALIDRLEQGGHVLRRPDPDDRRRTILELQPAAHALAAAFFGPLGDAYQAAMGRYDLAELQVVARFLQDVIDVTVAARERIEIPAGGGER